MEQIRPYLSQLIKEFRKRNAMSLDQFSEISEVSRSLIYQIEKQQSIPTLLVLKKIADAMGMGLQEIVAPIDQEKSNLKGNLNELAPHTSKDKSFVSLPIHSVLEEGDPEIYQFRFTTTGRHEAIRSSGVRLVVVIIKGELIIEANQSQVTLKTGDIGEFFPNKYYTYIQRTKRYAHGIAFICRL